MTLADMEDSIRLCKKQIRQNEDSIRAESDAAYGVLMVARHLADIAEELVKREAARERRAKHAKHQSPRQRRSAEPEPFFNLAPGMEAGICMPGDSYPCQTCGKPVIVKSEDIKMSQVYCALCHENRKKVSAY